MKNLCENVDVEIAVDTAVQVFDPVALAGEKIDGSLITVGKQTDLIEPKFPGHNATRRLRTLGYQSLGHTLFAVGFAGIFLPLLPTTIFWILATGCYAHSAPHLRDRIINHPKFGQAIANWLDHRVIERRPKIYAVAGIVVGLSVSAISLPGTVSVLVKHSDVGADLVLDKPAGDGDCFAKGHYPNSVRIRCRW